MSSSRTYSGYIPPRHFQFSSTQEAVACMVAALCAVECQRFERHAAQRAANFTADQAVFLKSNLLREWADGLVDPVVYAGREDGARESLVEWAKSVKEINSYFRLNGVKDPISFIEREGLAVRRSSGYGYDADLGRIEKVLGVRLAGAASSAP